MVIEGVELLLPHRYEIHGVYLLSCVLLGSLYRHHHIGMAQRTKQWVQWFSDLKVHYNHDATSTELRLMRVAVTAPWRQLTRPVLDLQYHVVIELPVEWLEGAVRLLYEFLSAKVFVAVHKSAPHHYPCFLRADQTHNRRYHPQWIDG